MITRLILPRTTIGKPELAADGVTQTALHSSEGSSVASTLTKIVVNVDGYTPSEEYSDARLAQKKVRVENSYQSALKAAKAQYDNAIRDAWNEMFLSDLGSSAVAKNDYADLVSTLEATLDFASSAYRSAAFAEYGAALDDFDMIDQIARYQQSRVDMGLSVPSDAFANLDDPDFEYQVCFAAGTLVHMADGSKKPIETIRPNDIVLASDHRNPESKPVPARVVRFFDNGLKEVVRLHFEGGEEIVCTPGHRFYVVGKGWTQASELSHGSVCLCSNGKEIFFVSSSIVPYRMKVYNLEVENEHTYYVGNSAGSTILVHNQCADCGASSGNIWHDVFGCPVAEMRNLLHGIELSEQSAVGERPLAYYNTIIDGLNDCLCPSINAVLDLVRVNNFAPIDEDRIWGAAQLIVKLPGIRDAKDYYTLITIKHRTRKDKEHVVIDQRMLLETKERIKDLPGFNEDKFVVTVLEKVENNKALTGVGIIANILPGKSNPSWNLNSNSTVRAFVVHNVVFIYNSKYSPNSGPLYISIPLDEFSEAIDKDNLRYFAWF